MELEQFKRAMWNRFKIRMHDIIVNTELKPAGTKGCREPSWTNIRWKDIPALVEASGHKYSTPMIKVLIGYDNRSQYSMKKYVYQIAFMKPLGEPNRFDNVVREYKLGYLNTIPREKSWLNRVTKIGSDDRSIPETNLDEAAWAFHIQEMVKGVLLWNSIITDPEISEQRKAYAEAKAKVRELSRVTTQMRNTFYKDGYESSTGEHYNQLKAWKLKASKQIEIKAEACPRVYGGPKAYV